MVDGCDNEDFKLGFRRHVVTRSVWCRAASHALRAASTQLAGELIFYTMGALFVFLAVILSC